MTQQQILLYSQKAPPTSFDGGLVAGTRDELDSMGLDTKKVANDLSILAGCSIDEESVKIILKNNLVGHTGRLIQLHEGNDGTNHTLTSAITMATLDMPPSSSPETASRTLKGHDPTDPHSPTTKAFYGQNPGLEPVDEEVSTRTSNQSIQHELPPKQSAAVLQHAALPTPPIHSKNPINSNVSTQSEVMNYKPQDTTASITSVVENVSDRILLVFKS